MILPLLVASLLSAQAGAPAPAPPKLDALLERAGEYFLRFGADFVNVVSEERYLQQAAGEQIVTRGTRSAIVTNTAPERRELLSDFLLVRLAGTEGWVPFRDTFDVDGKPVRDRQDRLSKLLLHPTEDRIEQAAQILAESTRHNIGSVQRTINTPLLSLTFLDPAHQWRFKYTLGKPDPTLGPRVWVVNYEERTRPAFVHNSYSDRDIMSRGRYWVDADTGGVLRTELILQDGTLFAIVTVSFRPDDRFKLNVPFEMVEEYKMNMRTRVSARASYSRFRRFDATATETIPTGPSRWITEPASGMVLVELSPGQFPMGSPASEEGRAADEAVRDVTISAPFYIGRYEVTAREWEAIMGSSSARTSDCGPRCPVQNVTFEEVERFLARLNARSAPGVRFRLPTEAEWEYACRAGTASPFFAGDSVTRLQANFSGKGSSPAGSFDPNQWGLHEMSGNVAEWTADWYAPYDGAAATDPTGPPSGETRVVRGGGWDRPMLAARCAARARQAPGSRRPGLGFRVAADFGGRP